MTGREQAAEGQPDVLAARVLRPGEEIRPAHEQTCEPYTPAMEQPVVWPDPVPCLPENPLQGIRRCYARANGCKCPWLGVDYCGIRADDMEAALGEAGFGGLSWIVEDDLEPDDVAEAAGELRKALGARGCPRGDAEGAEAAVRWLAGLLERVRAHGAGLSGRFAERLDLKDRY